MLMISETFINADKGYRFGESEPYEPYTDDVGSLFRAMRREYGRCVSSVYVDAPDGKVKRVGWVFRKRMEYEDYRGRGERFYTREVWVTLHDAPDTVTRESHFHALEG
jgi:hypothetical protein